jgi:hypothetical protein
MSVSKKTIHKLYFIKHLEVVVSLFSQPDIFEDKLWRRFKLLRGFVSLAFYF